MSELRVGERRHRCQRCGLPLEEHAQGCVSPSRNAYDMSHNNLAEIDYAAGELIKAIMEFKSIESIQNSSFASEFFCLFDLRRKS